MRKIALITMIFLCAFAKAQVVVNPETFPQVSGVICDKYLYTNTGGEGKIKVKTIWDSVPILDTTSISYNDFYTLISGGNLEVGKTYILVDFQTIYDQMDFDNTGALKGTLTTKTGAIEEIWVYALANDRIASTAYSKTYPNDKIQYDWTYNATLVNGTPAKGRISERIDEWNNRTDYDHREIKFIRYDDGNGNFVQINDSGRTSQEFLTFGSNYGTGGVIYDNWLGDSYSIGMLLGQEYSNNVFKSSNIISNKTSALYYNNTFNSSVGLIYNNNFSGFFNNNTFLNSLYNNNFSGFLVDNYFYDITISNTFSGQIINNIFNSTISNSLFIGEISDNSFNNIDNCELNGDIRYSIFSFEVANTVFQGNIINTLFTHSSYLSYLIINGFIQNKTIDETTYPFLFGTDFDKKIFQASDGNVYARYFDGTNDINVLIP